MNAVIEELLQIVEKDPLPAADTSSYWQLYGGNMTVERRGDELVLIGSGFGSMDVGGRLGRAASVVERLTYWRVTARLRSHASVWRTARRLARDLSVDLTFDVWRQSVALALLADHWTAYDLSPRTFAVIGDGHGFLGALVRRHLPQSRVYCIDLPKILVFQARTHELADRSATISIMSSKSVRPTAITFVLPKDVEVISDQIDCALNMASMQEMNHLSIASYFQFLSSDDVVHHLRASIALIARERNYLGVRSRASKTIHGRKTTRCSSMGHVPTTRTLSGEQAPRGRGCLGCGYPLSITLMEQRCIVSFAWLRSSCQLFISGNTPGATR